MKIVFLLVIVCAFGYIKAQNDYEDLTDWYDDWYDGWNGDGDERSVENLSPEDKGIGDKASISEEKTRNDDNEPVLDDNDDNVFREIEDFKKSLGEVESDEEDPDAFDDYQIEDNRSESKVDIPVLVPEQIGAVNDDVNENNDEQDLNEGLSSESDESKNDDEESVFSDIDIPKNNKNEEDLEDAFPAAEIDQINAKILEETKQILSEDDNNANEVNLENLDESNDDDVESEDFEDAFPANEPEQIESKISEETAKILSEDDKNPNEANLDEIESNIDDNVESEDFEDAFPANEPEQIDQKILDEVNQILSDENNPNEVSLENKDNSNVDEKIANDKDFDDELAKLFEELDNADSAEEEKISQEIESIFEQLSNKKDDPEDEPVVNDQSNSDGDDDDVNNEEEEKVEDNENQEEVNASDTVDDVIEDLNDDLKQLFETWDKLTNNSDDDDDNDNVNEENIDVLKYEEEFGKPYGEDVVLSQRDDDYEDILDTNLGDILNNIDEDTDKQEKTDDLTENDKEEVAEDTNEEDNKSEEKEQATKSKIKTIKVDELTPAQYDELMKQFIQVNADDLDTKSENFATDVAAVHIELSADKATVVTSPNYPNAYPTNNIVDWIFDGEGTGIELNITDFAVNGVMGDYLMVKPGGLDASGSDGLIFSYTLTEARRYRFLDVDRLFVRFQSNPGLAFMRGFQFGIKLISPLSQDPEDIPAPAPLLPAPEAVHTLYLNTTLAQFHNISDRFTEILAGMATQYINARGIDMGINTTSETTQITHTSACNINWPNSYHCVEVRFGVPLVYEDDSSSRLTSEELADMWESYKDEDPFATSLWRLGVTEFEAPNDARVLFVWLVIAGGVLISAAMLAAALWRFSCFQDYTRMGAFSDTDSLHSKRNLDLYPTPHQELPPLDIDDYKWDLDTKYNDTTRVDMGGFANRNFVADELLNIDSDDEVTVNNIRDRNITPSDIYKI